MKSYDFGPTRAQLPHALSHASARRHAAPPKTGLSPIELRRLVAEMVD